MGSHQGGPARQVNRWSAGLAEAFLKANTQRPRLSDVP